MGAMAQAYGALKFGASSPSKSQKFLGLKLTSGNFISRFEMKNKGHQALAQLVHDHELELNNGKIIEQQQVQYALVKNHGGHTVKIPVQDLSSRSLGGIIRAPHEQN